MLYHLFYVSSDWMTWGQMLLPFIFVTGVIVTFWYWSLWLMLLSHVGIDLWLMLLSHLMLVYYLADVMPCGVTPPPLVARGQFTCPWLGYCHWWFVRLMLLPYVQCSLAGVIASGQCYCHIIAVHVWLMLLPWWLMLNPPMGVLADVIAKVAWWNSHWVNVLILILMFCVGPHPIYETDGTCLYSCLGMGH